MKTYGPNMRRLIAQNAAAMAFRSGRRAGTLAALAVLGTRGGLRRLTAAAAANAEAQVAVVRRASDYDPATHGATDDEVAARIMLAVDEKAWRRGVAGRAGVTA